MKTLLIFLLTAILVVSCTTSKPTVKSPHISTVVLTDGDSIALPATAGIDPEESPKPLVMLTSSYIENRGEGIGLGNTHTLGHGAVHYEEQPQKIIKVNNSMISSKSTNMGHVAYKIPTEMKVRNTYQVIVRISKSTATIYENMNGEVRTSTIPITETMEVKLIDPSPDDRKMFDVIPDNDATQLVENNESVTQWSWNVTPIRTGQAQLKVMIAVITNGNRKETVYQDIVNVDTNLGKQIPFFFGKYWQWMLSTLVIPFGVWFYNRKKKKDEDGEDKPKKKSARKK
jgi:hypothetical protein